MQTIYFDNAATTQPSPHAIEAYNAAPWGNPSSLHALGLEAEKALNVARAEVANSIGCAAGEVYFTSCATECNNIAIFGAVELLRKRGKKIITTDSEHPSVSEVMKKLSYAGFEIVYLPTVKGEIPLDMLERIIDDNTILVSCMLANNETGAVYPIAEIAKIIAAKRNNRRILLHCDAVQAYLKQSIDVKRMGIDLLSVSGHKVYAGKGIGALYAASNVRLPAVMYGGGQEKGMRSGTENVAGACALGEMAKRLHSDISANLVTVNSFRSYIVQKLTTQIDGLTVNTPAIYSPYILSVTLPQIRSEVMLQFLSARGIFISSGSACSSKSGAVSPVLLAYGLSKRDADCTVRISFSHGSTLAEVDALIDALAEGCRSLTRLR